MYGETFYGRHTAQQSHAYNIGKGKYYMSLPEKGHA